VNRFLVLGFINWQQPELLKIKGRWCRDYAQSLIKPSLLYWLTDLGAFLILRTDAYFISFFKGVDSLPKYQAAYSLAANLALISISMASASVVFISQAWQAGNFELIQHLTFRNARVGLSLMAVGVGFVLSSGESLINVWLGKGNFIGYNILAVFCIMITLEVQHVIFVLSGRATEDEVYAPWALSSGFLNLIFTWLLIKPLGLLGVAMGTMFAQMLTNNWYAVYRPIKRLKLDFNYYLTQVISWWALLLISSYSLSKIFQQFLTTTNLQYDLFVVIASGTISSVLFLLFFWFKIMSSHQQNIVVLKAKIFLKFN
jgi:O-antigen/teichoic acid export membrane protein